MGIFLSSYLYETITHEHLSQNPCLEKSCQGIGCLLDCIPLALAIIFFGYFNKLPPDKYDKIFIGVIGGVITPCILFADISFSQYSSLFFKDIQARKG